MEDRHYLSEPRPIADLGLPTWEVDVMREGVDTPILTLRIDSEALPPRRGKKKKIVWKLPDDVNQIPKFGTEDKKRIFELYKAEKKLRRSMRKNSSILTPSTSLEDDNVIFDNDAVGIKKEEDMGDDDDHGEEEKQQSKDPPLKTTPNNGGGRVNGTAPAERFSGGVNKNKKHINGKNFTPSPEQEIQHRHLSSPAPPPSSPPVVKANGTPLPPAAPPVAPPGFQIAASVSADEEEAGDDIVVASNGSKNNINRRSPTADSIVSPSRPSISEPPPGLANDAPPYQSQQQQVKQQPQPQQPRVPPAPASVPPPPPGITPVAAPLPAALNTNAAAIHPPVRKTIPIPPGNTAIASIVAELYYSLLTHGLIHELLPLYTSTAQKSLTVGGAHAVCGPTLAEKELQLKHLVGIVVTIKGVLQQPTGDDGRVLVLITGICRRPHALPFCHSLILVPVTNNSNGDGNNNNSGTMGGYQIQNDALCFLTPESPEEAAAAAAAANI